MENIQPKQGAIYKDSQKRDYQIVVVAEYVERDETIVVYQELFLPYGIRAMQLQDFLRKFCVENCVKEVVEKNTRKAACKAMVEEVVESYSESEQMTEAEIVQKEIPSDDYPIGVNPVLMEFLEADTIHEKVKILIDNRAKVDDKCINDLAASLDISIDEGELDVRYYQLVSCLETMRKYEVLRR